MIDVLIQPTIEHYEEADQLMHKLQSCIFVNEKDDTAQLGWDARKVIAHFIATRDAKKGVYDAKK